MKKAIVLLLALAVLGGAAFAEDLAYTLTGSASLVWGYNLNTEHHGFTNTTSATLTIPLVAEQSSTHGEEAITGSITISDFTAGIDTSGATVSAGTVTAKILFPNDLYLQIASAPSFLINYATKFAPWVNLGWVDPGVVAPSITSTGGFTFGMTGDFSFALKVGSTNKHTDATGADDYMMGLDLGYTMGDMLTANVKFIYGSFQEDPAMMGLGAKFTSKPIEGLALVLGTDLKMYNDVTGMDLMFTADYTMADMFSFGAGAYFAKTDLSADPATLDARVRASLLAVENLTFKVGVDMWDLMADPANDPQKVLIGANLAYKAMLGEENYVKPYFNFGYALVSEGSYMNVGVEAGLIPLTTFTLNYVAGKITTNNITINPISGDADKGVITFTTKITY